MSNGEQNEQAAADQHLVIAEMRRGMAAFTDEMDRLDALLAKARALPPGADTSAIEAEVRAASAAAEKRRQELADRYAKVMAAAAAPPARTRQ